jgi:hypothetical protein
MSTPSRIEFFFLIFIYYIFFKSEERFITCISKESAGDNAQSSVYPQTGRQGDFIREDKHIHTGKTGHHI